MIPAACSADTVMIATPATVSETTGHRTAITPSGAQRHHASLMFEFDGVRTIHRTLGPPVQQHHAVGFRGRSQRPDLAVGHRRAHDVSSVLDALGQRDDDPFGSAHVGHPPRAPVFADTAHQAVAAGCRVLDRGLEVGYFESDVAQPQFVGRCDREPGR